MCSHYKRMSLRPAAVVPYTIGSGGCGKCTGGGAAGVIVSEQREQGAYEQYQQQTYQESDESADEYVTYLLLVDDRVYDHDNDQDDDSGEYAENERSQQSYDESDQSRRIAQIETFLLCH